MFKSDLARKGVRMHMHVGKVAALIASISLMTLGASDSAEASAAVRGRGSSFCEGPMLRDYEAGLRVLPAPSPLPRTGKLPFGPSALSVSELGNDHSRLLFTGGQAAFQMTNSSQSVALTLNWVVQIAVVRVGPDGSAGAPVISTHQVGSIPAGGYVRLSSPRIAKAGPYRVDFFVSTQSDTPLGNYSEYLRVVPSKLDVRLGVDVKSINPGSVLSFRLENLGTQEIRSGLEYVIEKKVSGTWHEAAFGATKFLQSLSLVAAGQAGRCQRLQIPKSAEDGRYRVRKVVTPLTGSRRELQIAAPFTIQ